MEIGLASCVARADALDDAVVEYVEALLTMRPQAVARNAKRLVDEVHGAAA